MCGIMGVVAERSAAPLLLAGLKRLEYRGYDSAGMVTLHQGHLERRRAAGKVAVLEARLTEAPLGGSVGLAHTRWATHGAATEDNAHPMLSGGRLAVVHNGIIENHAELRAGLVAAGYRFESETDTEVIAHLVHQALSEGAPDLVTAVRQAIRHCEGAYAIGVIDREHPEQLVAARAGSPLVLGLGVGENFLASDGNALLPLTQRFIDLEEGDLAVLKRDSVRIFDQSGDEVLRPVRLSRLTAAAVDRGQYRHFTLKEIHEQPQAVAETLEGRITAERILSGIFGPESAPLLARVREVRLIGCGTSYHAALVARDWFEDILRLPARAEIASEFRSRHPVLADDALYVFISQSGETIDTLDALDLVRRECPSAVTLSLCNVPESAIPRATQLKLLTHAGPEIGVASTKAFTTQLTALALLLLSVGRVQQRLPEAHERRIVDGLHKIPGRIRAALAQEDRIRSLAERLVDKQHALFLGRGTMQAIALEGALKLKEISYIHAEGYPAGELKHGPLALIDETMPVIAIAPQNDLLAKLKSNLAEVAARGGELFVFADETANVAEGPGLHVVPVAHNVGRISAPILFTVPLQLLAYHVAVLRGTDVDQPRNLAKSVTVK